MRRGRLDLPTCWRFAIPNFKFAMDHHSQKCRLREALFENAFAAPSVGGKCVMGRPVGVGAIQNDKSEVKRYSQDIHYEKLCLRMRLLLHPL